MNEKLELLKKIIETGLKKSVERINKISSYKWEIEKISFEIDNVDKETICVYLVAPSFNKISFLLFVEKKDSDNIFRSFSGYSFGCTNRITKVEELLISELGNIILNSVLGEIANRIKMAIVPQSPKTINGYKKFLLEGISSMIDTNINKTVVSSSIYVKASQDIKLELYFFFENSIFDLI